MKNLHQSHHFHLLHKECHLLSNHRENHYLQIHKNYKQKLQNPYHKIKIGNSKTIPIASIRGLKKKLFFSKSDENWSVVIISDAEKLCNQRAEAANSLLKILEEPPERTLFIIISSNIIKYWVN